MKSSRLKANKICSVSNCGKRVRSMGFCNAHYNRFRRYGDPNITLRPANGVVARFYNEVVLEFEGNDCLIWPYYRNDRGYAAWGGVSVSRMVCEFENGPPPAPKLEAAHSCGNGSGGCVSRRHLSWKTRQENEDDKVVHGTSIVGERNGRSRLSEDDVRTIISLRGVKTTTEVGSLFGITQSHVSAIQNGRRWAFLQDKSQ